MSLRSEHSRRGAHRAVAAVNSPASAPPGGGDPTAAVYAAEDAAAAAFPPRRYRSFAELRSHIAAIVCSDWWSDTFPGAPIEVHVERRSRTATFSAACRRDGAGIVWFVDGQHWNATAVCHELAHVASDSGHDALFREALVALWRRECGFLAATELSAQLGHRSIWRPTFER